jgi:hypothetical protein
MAKRKSQKRDDIPEDLKHMDDVSPVGGYDGPDAESEAAKEAVNEDLPAPDLSNEAEPESEEESEPESEEPAPEEGEE